MMIPAFDLRPLPFPGAPFFGESGSGFFLRMAERNGLELREFFTLLERDPKRPLRPEDAPILARLFDCRVYELDSLFVTSTYGNQYVQRFDFQGHLITRMYLLDLQHPKVCPCCLADSGYARTEWDLSLFLWCPVHQSALIDRCPSCGCRLNWFRPGMSTCSCRHRLDKPTPKVDPSWGVKAMAVLLTRFIGESNSPNVRFPQEINDVLSVLAALSLDGAMRLIWILGVETGFKSDLANARRRREISTAASVIDDGFARLLALLRRAHIGTVTTSSDPPSRRLISALRLMVEDGATEGDRHLAQSCIDVILPSRSRKKSRSTDAGIEQLSLLFEIKQ